MSTALHRRGQRTATILVLDDDDPLRSAAARVLSRAGYQVLQAANATDGLHVAAGWSGLIDLLICDLVLPGLSGREAANALLARRPDMKVLFTSGYWSRGSFRRDLDQPGGAFLSKPFEVPDLMRAVKAVLSGEPWPPPPPVTPQERP